MKFTVINHEISVEKIKIDGIEISSNLIIGDVPKITLTSWFESPPENVIVGVTPMVRTME
ncbi:spore gernimation protein GerPD [Ammoniphilus resinae]|uniref:Spore germination protein PD n=1 Tax=Ammoniphilus resinae TaxID=861532 RepID=A0ABS4GQ54_9BACL|nr:spore gernimation protein GerPD [Ammoniphilus resinae]MBP1932405.1 spore germination protein PD [Ammoniphilus resinae]